MTAPRPLRAAWLARWLPGLLALALGLAGAGAARAASLQAASVPPAAPGTVVAIPLTVSGAGSLTVHTPKGLTALGTSTPAHGHALATVLVQPSAPAGEHSVEITLRNGPHLSARTTVDVTVEAVHAASLHAQASRFVVAGKTLHATVSVTNDGNAPATFALRASGDDPMRLTPRRLHVAPGDSASARLAITPRGFGQRVALVTARPSGGGKTRQVSIAYRVLPFPGAEPGAPQLHVRLPLSVSYGTGGLRASAGAHAGGDLSSFVTTDSGFRYGYPDSVSAQAGLVGRRWSARYALGPDGGSLLQGSYGPLSGSLHAGAGRTSAALGYDGGPWSVRVSHAFSPHESDAVSLAYGVRLAPWLSFRARAGATGRSLAAGYRVGPLVGGRLSWAGGGTLGDLAGRYTPRSTPGWRVRTDIYSQSVTPFGFGIHLTGEPGTLAGSATLDESLGPVLRLRQHVAYDGPYLAPARGAARGTFSVTYALPASLGSVRVAAHANLKGGTARLSQDAAAVVAPLPWVTTIRVHHGRRWRAAADETFQGDGFAVGAGAAATLAAPLGPRLDVHASVALGPVTTGLGVGYATATGRLFGHAEVRLALTHDLALRGSVARDPQGALRYRVGLSASVLTGFRVPRRVVEAFGGRDLGTVRGRVLVRTPAGTKPLGGALVVAAKGERQARTDDHGRFTLRLAPGKHVLELPKAAVNLSRVGTGAVRVRLHRTTHVTLTMKRSYTISGQAFLAAPGSTRLTSGAKALRFVGVQLVTSSGERSTATTDAHGNFLFTGLRPGAYRLGLVARTLPNGDRPLHASVKVTLGRSGSTSVELGAAPPKERVARTLSTGSIGLDANVSPSSAPPGATLTVTASAPAATAVTAHWPGGRSAPLEQAGGNRFRGSIQVPGPAKGTRSGAGTGTPAGNGAAAGGGKPAGPHAVTLTVTATGKGQTVSQDLTVVVRPGPLADLSLSPGFAAAGQRVQVQAHLLVHAADVAVRVGQATIQLSRTAPGSYAGSFAAPDRAGTFTVTLLVDGRPLARGRVAVSAPGK